MPPRTKKIAKPFPWQGSFDFLDQYKLFILPSLAGLFLFFIIPTGFTLFYAFTNIQGQFVFFSNFVDVLTNMTFQLAAQNSFRFIVVSLPLNIAIAFMLASFLQGMKNKQVLALMFLLPMVVPSGAVVFFWNVLFADNGAINRMLLQAGRETIPWLFSDWAFTIVVLIFLVRNVGFNLVLFMAGYQFIPADYYEVAKVEGAGPVATFRHVTGIYMLPTVFVVFMMSIINSFRIFREIYLLYGPYPHGSVYMLQHFMNNQFISANMRRLSVTATLFGFGVTVLVVGVFTAKGWVVSYFNGSGFNGSGLHKGGD